MTGKQGWECKSTNPVNFFTGENFYFNIDFRTAGLSTWGVTRIYVNDASLADGMLGPCWRFGEFLRVIPKGSSIWIVSGDTPVLSFTDNGNGTYSPQFDYTASMVADTVNHLLVVTDSRGNRWDFHDLTGSWSGARQGRFKQYADPGGNITTAVYGSSGVVLDKILEVQQTDPNPAIFHRFVFNYNLSGSSIGLVASVNYIRTVSSVSTTVRNFNYSYYGSTGPNGPAGTLQRVRITDGSGATIDTYYYRYDAMDGTGWVPLRYVVHPEAYERLLAALGSDAAIDAAADSTIAVYADYYFQYGANHVVLSETVQGKGCGCSSSGSKGLFTYDLFQIVNGIPDGPNVWRRRNTMTLPDGNQRIVYMNGAGQTMLEIFKEVSTGTMWRKYWQFNADGSIAAVALPSAVTGHDESIPGLVSSAHLPDATGLWHLFNYYSTTNIPAGAVAKYGSTHLIRQGELGTAILQQTHLFTSHVGASGTVYPLLSDVVYRNTDGTGAQTTSFSYTWQGTSNQVLQATTTSPIVTAAQNGSNAATSQTIQFDAFGRQSWSRDEDGFIRFADYDTLSGGVTTRIDDVNTSLVTNEPVGWVTPAGGGLHLTTTTLVDGLGRATKRTDPIGNITYIVYKDTQHETRMYPGWNSSTNTPTGPTRVVRDDHLGSYVEQLTMTAAPAVSGGVPTGTEAISGLRSLSRSYQDTGGRETYKDSYFDFTGLTYSTAPNIGTLGVHYYRAFFNYDIGGRKDRSQDWAGTISRLVFDSQNRVVSLWVGTDDTPITGDWSPTNTAGTNLIKSASFEYDNGGVGDGNLTRSSSYTSAGTTLDTIYVYDFRNRPFQQRLPDKKAFQNTYDNLDQVTTSRTYADIDQNFVIGATELRDQRDFFFDERGQTYRTVIHNVDPVSGAIGNHLTTNNWYDGRKQNVKIKGPNGQHQKMKYDGASRSVALYTGYDDAETSYADALTVTGDILIEQQNVARDGAGNRIQTTRYRRTSTTTKTGDLSISWAAGQSRRTFVAEWYDLANRQISRVDYGDNGGSNLTRPATPPAPNTSDNYLVSKYEYDDGGRTDRVTDNKGRVTKLTLDGLGRPIRQVENFTGAGTPLETDLDVNRTREYVFDASGRIWKQVVHNPKGAGQGVQLQITQYVYGTIANQAMPAVFRNDLLAAEIHPDSDDTYNSAGAPGAQLGAGADGVYDRIEYVYDYAGRRSTITDQRGTVRTLTYDSAGRLQSDAASALGSGIDGSVRRFQYGYDSLARLEFVTSFDAAAGGLALNEVKFTYDGWGRAIKCEQAHGGVVGVGTPATTVALAEGAVGGEAKYVRPASTTYPNGRIVYTNYPASGIGDKLSRVDNLANDAAGTSIFAQYTYLGINDYGRIDHPLVTNGLRLEVDTGGNPTEWDRFGRVTDQRWKRSGATFNYDRFEHTYDRMSNRLTRDVTANNAPTNKDEFYVYDGLDRLTKLNRGVLASGQITDVNAVFSQKWTQLESIGNWREFQVAPNGANNYTFVQSRAHNAANEIDTDNNDANAAGNSISGIGGADWVDPTADKGGALKSGPQPGAETSRLHHTYDAWDRLTKVQADSGGSPGATLAEYQYDGSNRRIVKLKPNGANWDRTDYYYTCTWQVLEERTAANVTKTTIATVPKFQWVWDLRHMDAVVLRDENKDGDGDCVDGTDQRLFYTQDGNFNTTALVNTAGTVVERYVYDAYGSVAVLSGTWTAQSPTLFNNEILFTGQRNDPETGLHYFKERYYSSALGRFVTRDPVNTIGRADRTEFTASAWVDPRMQALVQGGMSMPSGLYELVSSRPLNFVDPLGLQEVPTTKEGGTQAIKDSAAALKALCEKCCRCKGDCKVKDCQDEADRIASTLAQVWHDNFDGGDCTDPTCRGRYYCYEWSTGFREALLRMKPKLRCWEHQQEFARLKNSNDSAVALQHYWLVVWACKHRQAECAMYYDDNNSKDGWVHSPPWPPSPPWERQQLNNKLLQDARKSKPAMTIP
jgi:RHS repeat-associated protein